MSDHDIRDEMQRESHRRLRDKFAAAALTGLLTRREYDACEFATACEYAYRYADAMLRERDTTNHDAAPAARAPADSHAPRGAVDRESVGTDKAEPLNRDCGTGDISEAQIDALECVVEDGRIVGMSVYGHLRSLLVSLRPEWEGQSYSEDDEKRGFSNTKRDTTEPRNGALSDTPDPDSRVWETPCTPPPQATPQQGSVQGEGGFRDSRNAKEPVAWAVMATGIGSITPLCHDRKEAQQLAARLSDPHAKAVPLYRHSQPTLTDEEREAVRVAILETGTLHSGEFAKAETLRKMLERLA